ncbi:MAG: isoaspartyl peptidase/L-asparaginase [Gammaproteobacteria bacterium]|nr:isoaspartyl peptidase/L-asparaginase [Gammaproteobacteria bacterium]
MRKGKIRASNMKWAYGYVFLAMSWSMNGSAATGTCDSQDEYILLLHGGFASAPERVERQHLEVLNQAVTAGLKALANGATALDVVEDSIVLLEDAGIYDAGKGSYFNSEGFVENDASLMEGHTGRAGAVAAVQSLKNPIRAARIAMDRTPHVLFVGATGEATLIELGAEAVEDPKTYFKEYRPPTPQASAEEHGTVGAVALDRCGNLAAGTSTGGTPGKMPGRVGDSPIIGASSFANKKYALSATGKGEHFIRRAATHDIAARAEYLGVPLQEAADYVVRDLIGDIDQAQGAIIAISAAGDIVLSSNGYGVMYGVGSNVLAATVGAEVKYE